MNQNKIFEYHDMFDSQSEVGKVMGDRRSEVYIFASD